MKIIRASDYSQMSMLGAAVFEDLLKKKPNATLGLATGTTPIGLYGILADAYRKGMISFKETTAVNLDEYVGLGERDTQSYVYFMRDKLYNHIDIDLKNTHLPDGKAKDTRAECERYTKLLAGLPRDIQLLGLGSNGHIGFNEPGSPFGGHTRVVGLTESTIADNARLFANPADVPREAITMGIADIMQSKKILVLVSGANKAKAVLGMVKGEVTEACPASVLQTHPDVTVIADEAAASLL